MYRRLPPENCKNIKIRFVIFFPEKNRGLLQLTRGKSEFILSLLAEVNNNVTSGFGLNVDKFKTNM